ncbi:alpha/beta hydrolase [Pseudomaricurvus alkylphenolicus]|uniref:alpha/beta fold hydrolase n=1 Tax=Pseudomaricurvus alkylphenolicus TaxID=1306991 RepID=UPI00141F1F40|nr:alpha/beta hydrolase [Pseudomaricurvus alkylphenolicus]NIB42438.1 alpha/beta hydrolase [Pseudomaricurvus alkylphenolicus]
MSTLAKGIYSNSMAWAAMGDGDKVAVMIPGGPGNPHPGEGMGAKALFKPYRELMAAGYKVICIARKRNMPQGYSIEQMAKDYAEVIATELGGQVDLVVGSSYGGMVGQFIAANHPECTKKMVLHVAACQINEPIKSVDVAFGKAMAEGKSFKAGALYAEGLFPNMLPALAKFFAGTMMWMMGGSGKHEYYANDVVVEAEAEVTFDTREALPKISIPVLMISGDKDYWFSEALTLETAELIPGCQLKMYQGKGHLDAAMDPRSAEDILEFIA